MLRNRRSVCLLAVLAALQLAGCAEHVPAETVARCAAGIRLEPGVTPPKASYRAYPNARRVPGVELFSCLEITVGADGSVGDVVVVEARDPKFDAAAQEAVKKWRYIPAHKGGRPVALRMRVLVYNYRPPVFGG